MRKILALILATAPLFLVGCGSLPGPKPGNSYSSSEVNTELEVRFGTVQTVREVQVERSGLLGALAGGAAGMSVGAMLDNSLLKLAVIASGALVGHNVTASQTPGDELTIKLDSGKTVVIVQERSSEMGFRAGDRIRITSNGETSRVFLTDEAKVSRGTLQPMASKPATRVEPVPAVSTPQVTPTSSPAPKKRKAKVTA